MKFLVTVHFCKHSLHFLIPLPCIRYPSSLTKQNYLSELPDLHDSRYIYTLAFNSNQDYTFEVNLPNNPIFLALLYIAKQSLSTRTTFLLNKTKSENELQMYIVHAPTTNRNSATQSDKDQLEIKPSPPVQHGCQVLST